MKGIAIGYSLGLFLTKVFNRSFEKKNSFDTTLP